MSLFPNKGWVVGVTQTRACLVARAGDGQRVLAELEGNFSEIRQQEALLLRLLQKADGRPPPVKLVLGDDLTRFGVVPPLVGNPHLSRDALTEIARSRLNGLYGDMAGWSCAVDQPRWGQPALACAISESWRTAMGALGRAHRCRFQRCAPAYVWAWNRHGASAAQKRKGSVVFMLMDVERLTLGVHRSGAEPLGWSFLRQVRHAGAESVTAVVDQELGLAGEDITQPQCMVSLIPVAKDALRPNPRRTVVDLSLGGRLSRQQALASLGWP